MGVAASNIIYSEIGPEVTSDWDPFKTVPIFGRMYVKDDY